MFNITCFLVQLLSPTSLLDTPAHTDLCDWQFNLQIVGSLSYLTTGMRDLFNTQKWRFLRITRIRDLIVI